MKNLIRLLTTFLLTLSISICSGQLIVDAGAKYQRNDGSYSQFFFREIELRTGVELNSATSSRNYEMLSDYAVIWFAQDQVAIVKLDEAIQPNGSRLMGEPIA